MPPLVVCTLLLWYALGYRLATLRRGNRRSVRILVEKYQNGYSRKPSGIIDSAIVEGLKFLKTNTFELRENLDALFFPYEKEISKFGVLVNSIVIIAPLAGLLGTVSGMIETFDSLGDMTLFSQSGGVAGGISQALFSTQLGLAVGVPGSIVGKILKRREQNMRRELAQIKDILCLEG